MVCVLGVTTTWRNYLKGVTALERVRTIGLAGHYTLNTVTAVSPTDRKASHGKHLQRRKSELRCDSTEILGTDSPDLTTVYLYSVIMMS